MKSKSKRRRNWLLNAAICGITLGFLSIALPAAQAQYRVGNDGHARDASNQIGSGGYNGGGSTSPYAINGNQAGNQIVTGNVTAGREFHGFVPYTASGAFSQQLPGTAVDRFVSQSAGVPIGAYNNNNAQNVLPFYGQSFGAVPPPGISDVATSFGQYLPVVPDVRTSGDTRLGLPFDSLIVQPQAGQTVLAGPVDNSQQPTVITASPLYGVRQWKIGDTNDQQFLQNYTDLYGSARNRTQIETDALQRMRSELQQQQTPDANLDANGANKNPADNSNGDGTNNANKALDNSLDNSSSNQGDLNRPLNSQSDSGQPVPQNQPLNNSADNGSALNNSRPVEGTTNRLLTNKNLSRTSGQYQELQARFKKYNRGGDQVAQMEQNRQFEEDRRTLKAITDKEAGGPNGTNTNQPANANAGTQTPAPGNAPAGSPMAGSPMAGNTGNAPMPGVTTPGSTPAAVPPVNGAPKAGNSAKPLQIASFAKDMKKSAASDMMKEAEQDMHDGKFTRALDKYDMVQQVAPNDPMVSLATATAELGASYYTRASAHLREAFTRNQELLLGQYDLRTLLGDDRLAFLVKDLKDLANRNKEDPKPAFLLAYIAYNSGNERNAGAYLDLADKRANGKDPFYKLVRSRWNLPTDNGAETGAPAGNPSPNEPMNK